MKTSQQTMADIIGTNDEEDFLSFDLTRIQQILQTLQHTESVDIAHAELLQHQALQGADIISNYLGKIVKTVGYLENTSNRVKNKASLEYTSDTKVTMEMRKWAGEASAEYETYANKLSKAKATKVVLEKKYEILIKLHHHYKDIATGYRKVINTNQINPTNNEENTNSGWDNV